MELERNLVSIIGKLCLVCLLLSTIGFLSAFSTTFQVISTGPDHTDLRFELPEYEVILNRVINMEFQRIYHPEASYFLEEGLPEIPYFTTMLAIPDRGAVSVEILKIDGTRIEDEVLFFPSQGFDMIINEETGFIYDKKFYTGDVSYPGIVSQIGSPAILRDYRNVSVAVYPFSYNPAKKELKVHQNIEIRVNYDLSVVGQNELERGSRKLSRSFENIYQGAFLNYDQFRNFDLGYQARSILVIYHHTPLFEPIVNQFVNWKRDKGFEITATNTENLSSNTAIKGFIQNAYNNWEHPPEYVILIGGGTGSHSIPTFNVHSAAGDHPYGLLEGDDDLSDVFVGRLPIGNMEHLTTIWNKIRNYEREPFLGNTEWYEHSLLIGDGTTSSGISPTITIRYIKELMQLYNENYQFTEHYSGSISTVTNNAFNQGMSFFPFRGWLNMAGWSPSDSALNNGLMLPNCFFMTCSTLAFNNTSRAEAIVNIGTPVVSKGGIGAIGMTTSSTRTAFNNALLGSFFYGIFNENIRTMGETLARGKLFLHQTFGTVHPAKPPIHSQKASFMGDPSLDIWVEVPKSMTVVYNESLPIGANFIDIIVTDEDNQPVKDAWVTIRQADPHETLFVTGYTDENGSITHYFSPDTEGTVNLTVTKPDYIPHLGNFAIDGQPSVGFYELTLNGIPDAGNNLGLSVTLKNYLNRTAALLNGTISSDSEFVSITGNFSNYNDIPVGGTTQSLSEYQIYLSPATPSGYRAEFDLSINESYFNNWTSRFIVTVNNGNLVLQNVSFGSGGVLEPTQTDDMYITLLNSGNTDISQIYGVLRNGIPGISIIDSTAFWGNVNVGQTVTNTSDSFVLSASGNIIPGTVANFELFLYNNSGFEQVLPIQLTIGTVTVNDPLGPDNYGYRCYDWGDTGYSQAPEYQWIEIAPQLGGNGTNTGLQSDHNNLQQVMNMNLPFTFRFYGIDYDVVSICANGWISFGVTEQATFRNYYIPGPMGPNPIIAAFWDNLSLANGGVYTHHDPDQSIFIIQWHNTRNRVNNAEVTFQIILYDPTEYLTPTGDGDIKIQYKVFNNLNNMTGPEWGNYCTVGIGDHTGNDGMTYTFANQYPTAARTLANETAIFFTAGEIDYGNAYIAIETISFSGGASTLPQYGETLNMNVSLNNLGGETAGSVTATLSTTDPFIQLIQDTADFGVIEAETIVALSDAFSFSVSDDVPDQHQAMFFLNLQSSLGMSWQHNYSVSIQAPEFLVDEPFIYDSQPGGNNDGIIDPGEMITLSFPVKNIGHALSEEVTVSFISSHPLVTIVENLHSYRSYLAPNEYMYPSIIIDVDDSIAYGSSFSIGYLVDSANYEVNGSFDLIVGGEMTLELGSGTSTNSGTAANPINIYFRSLRGQTVYTAAELNAAGISGGGLLTEFGFYVTSPPNLALPDFIIRMKHTTANNSASHDDGPFEIVYQNSSYMPSAGGWDMLTLETPFQWNGVDNILVDTAFAQVTSWSSSGQQRIYNVPNGFRFVRADWADQTNATTTSTSSNKPQARMVFGGVTSGEASIRPQNLTVEFADESVNLMWQAPADSRVSSVSEPLRTLRNGFTNQEREKHILVRERTLLGYNVYRNGLMINQQLVTITEYTDSEIAMLTDYFYYVTAVYTDQESIPSNIEYIEIESRVETPVMEPAGGYFNEVQEIIISSAVENVVLRYTTDGSEPDEDSPVYLEPIQINHLTTLKAKAYKENWLPSETAEERYVIMYAPSEVSIIRNENQVILHWTESPDAIGYHIYSTENYQLEEWGDPVFTESNQYLYEVLPSEEIRFFRIKAVYEDIDLLRRHAR